MKNSKKKIKNQNQKWFMIKSAQKFYYNAKPAPGKKLKKTNITFTLWKKKSCFSVKIQSVSVMRTMCCVVLWEKKNYVEEKPKNPFFEKKKKEKQGKVLSYYSTIYDWAKKIKDMLCMNMKTLGKLQPQEENLWYEKNWTKLWCETSKERKKNNKERKNLGMIYRLWAQDLDKIDDVMLSL